MRCVFFPPVRFVCISCLRVLTGDTVITHTWSPGVLGGSEDKEHGADATWQDYAGEWEGTYGIRRHPDVILINLGTNDSNLLPEQGDGLRNAFEERVYSFTKKLGQMHPKANVFWCYGMIGDPLMPQIRQAVERLAGEEDSSRYHVIELENTEEGELGSLSKTPLNSILGWYT